MDVDGDGIVEYWKVFYAGSEVLEKEQVEDHPFAVCVPIPIPHRAIGTCPAEQVAPIQYRKSHLVRNMLDNVYQSNYPRVMHSNKVDLDDLLTPRAGGTIEVDTDVADVGGHAVPLVVPNMIGDVLTAIEYTDVERETRTGVTRYTQGLDADSLNKTATGFKGMMDASQQRQELVARMFADGGVKQIFQKTVDIQSKNQETPQSVKVAGKPTMIDPREWGQNTRCVINVGLGSGDRNEKIMNLNHILNIQERFMGQGMMLSDQEGMFKTLGKIIDEVGLKDVQSYFNNPALPEEILMAQLQVAEQQNAMLQQQLQNPLAEAEAVKREGMLAVKHAELEEKQRQFNLKFQQDNAFKQSDFVQSTAEMELKYDVDLPGGTEDMPGGN
jgi:hypothetical protein